MKGGEEKLKERKRKGENKGKKTAKVTWELVQDWFSRSSVYPLIRILLSPLFNSQNSFTVHSAIQGPQEQRTPISSIWRRIAPLSCLNPLTFRTSLANTSYLLLQSSSNSFPHSHFQLMAFLPISSRKWKLQRELHWPTTTSIICKLVSVPRYLINSVIPMPCLSMAAPPLLYKIPSPLFYSKTQLQQCPLYHVMSSSKYILMSLETPSLDPYFLLYLLSIFLLKKTSWKSCLGYDLQLESIFSPIISPKEH